MKPAAPSIRDWIIHQHYQPQVVLGWWWLMALPTAIYELLVLCRTLAYRQGWLPVTQLPIPVWSVGNLTTGGTGKTPLVIALASHLLQQGKRVVILSRGYGAKTPQTYARATHPDFGDEAYLIQQALPQAVVIVGRNRQQTAQRAVTEFQPDVVLLDDGFQYQGLARTINCLLVDAQLGWGNGHLLPLGPLREPVSAARRATAIIATRWPEDWPSTHQTPWLEKLKSQGINHPLIPLKLTVTGLRHWSSHNALPLEKLAGQTVVAISAIAQPDQFEALLRKTGAKLLHHHRLPDHHGYQPADFNQAADWLSQHPQAWLVTTAKDAVKWASVCPSHMADRVYLVEVGFELPDVLKDLLLVF